jgi:hypothetical protein
MEQVNEKVVPSQYTDEGLADRHGLSDHLPAGDEPAANLRAHAPSGAVRQGMAPLGISPQVVTDKPTPPSLNRVLVCKPKGGSVAIHSGNGTSGTASGGVLKRVGSRKVGSHWGSRGSKSRL